MNQISFKKIAVVFGMLFVLSRSARILEWLQDYQGGRILTLEPLARCSEMSRYIATMGILFTLAVAIWKLLTRK